MTIPIFLTQTHNSLLLIGLFIIKKHKSRRQQSSYWQSAVPTHHSREALQQDSAKSSLIPYFWILKALLLAASFPEKSYSNID